MVTLYRSKQNKIIGGICGGIGEITSFDPTIIRLIVAAGALLTGFFPMVIAYCIAWLIIPRSKGNHVKPEVKLYRSLQHKMIAGICGGIGEIMDVDPTIIRLLLVFVTLVTGIFPLTFTYVVAWMIIPVKPA